MSTIHTKIRLENSCDQQSRVLEIRALVDSSAFHLCVPASVARALNLEGISYRFLKQPSGERLKCRYLGPVTLQCGKHQCFCGVVEYGDEVVIGSLALGYLGLALDVTTLQLVSVPARTGVVYTAERAFYNR